MFNQISVKKILAVINATYEFHIFIISVFNQVSKHLELGLKNSAAPHFFNLRLGGWIS